MPKNPIANYL